jgi:hypothetical protein
MDGGIPIVDTAAVGAQRINRVTVVYTITIVPVCTPHPERDPYRRRDDKLSCGVPTRRPRYRLNRDRECEILGRRD